MKIYTKKGDKGSTSLIGGKRVPKNHQRIEAYGSVDELIAFIGVVRDYVGIKEIINDLVHLQDQLMVCAAILADDSIDSNASFVKLSDEAIVWLENKIDEMDAKLPLLKKFLLPGGHPAVSFAHVARTVCRRAERRIVTLSEFVSVPEIILRYFNRLSDYLFVLSRFISHELKASEIRWQPRLY